MNITWENAVTGCILFCCSALVILLNLSVMFVLIKNNFLIHRHNGIYILSFANLIGDTIQQILVVTYVAPTSITQSYLINGDKDHPLVTFLSYCFLLCWYEGVLIQILIALDRLMNVVFPMTAYRFNLQSYAQFAIIIYIVSAFMAIWSQFISPCCKAYIYYGSFGYAYLGNGFNYSDHFVDLPLNSITTIVIFSCYAWIYSCVRRSNRVAFITDDRMSKRRSKEIKFAMQFSVSAFVLAFTWISFRVFPLLIPASIPQLYCIITIALSIHCSSNACAFITMNSEFIGFYRRTFPCTHSLYGKNRPTFQLSTVQGSRTSAT